MLSYSDQECQEAQEWLETTLLCLKRACPKLPRELRKLILCWGTQFIHETSPRVLPGSHKNLLTLVAANKINLNSIPQEFRTLFTDPINYGSDEFLSYSTIHPKPLNKMIKRIKKSTIKLENILQISYNHRELAKNQDTFKESTSNKKTLYLALAGSLVAAGYIYYLNTSRS